VDSPAAIALLVSVLPHEVYFFAEEKIIIYFVFTTITYKDFILFCAGPISENWCPQNCSGSGTCQDGHCMCSRATSGKNCGTFCLKGCSGHGVCVHGACLCATHFHGDDCGLFVAPANLSPATSIHSLASHSQQQQQGTHAPSHDAFEQMMLQVMKEEQVEKDDGVIAGMNLMQESEGAAATEDVGDLFEQMLKDELAKEGALSK
jgi:hypothetical protein